MDSKAFRSAIIARPFEPFDIHPPDGGSIPVRHPGYVAHSGGRTALVFLGETDYERVDVGLITRPSVHPVPNPPPTPRPAQAFCPPHR